MARDKSEEDLLRELCIGNGLDVSDVLQNGGKKTKKLEMFFFGIPRLCSLQHFPNLRVLRIVNQSVENIEGLSGCPLLEELWLAECRIQRIQGLSHCVKLRKLYLYQNCIARVEGLAGLDELTTLWLNSNKITSLEGLNHLKSLRNLNLAENSISSIGDSVLGLDQLQVLNISANKIELLENVSPLFSLHHLEELSFSDPAHGPNPFSSLCNYSTHLLYHLPQLKRLDGRDVTHPHLRNVIQLAVFRKKQFYRMRSHHVDQDGVERRHQLLRTLSSELAPLQGRVRELRRRSRGGRGLPAAADRVRALEDHCQKLVESCAAQCRVEEGRSQLLRQWLELELATAGNVTCLVGTPSDPWYPPCVELVEQRAAGEGLKGACVVGVCRVENRSTQLRFEEAVREEQQREREGEGQVGNLDYEFLVWREGLSLDDVVAKGKFPQQEHGGVLLTSSVRTAVKNMTNDMSSTKSKSVTLVLCQVFAASSSGGGAKGAGLENTVMRSSDLVLPEYIVELSVVAASSSHRGSGPVLLHDDRDILSQLPPATPADLQMEELTGDRVQQGMDTECPGECDASDRGILRLSPSLSSAVAALTALDLSFNRLTSTQHIADMPLLVTLNLRYNAVTSLEGMKGLPKLQSLDISWNCLKSLVDVSAFLRNTIPTLTNLDLRGNECEEQIDSASLRLFLIGQMKLLQSLNGSEVTGEEAELALRAVVSSHLSMATVVSKVRTNLSAPPSLSLLTTAEQLISSSKMRPSQMAAEQSDWWKEVTCVCTNDQGLVQIKAMGKCPNLKWACFRGNYLQHVDGLEECPQLEELTLDRNWLRSLDSVCRLKHLVRLSLSHNLLPSLSALGRGTLPDLQLLDVSNNRLTSLGGVEECPALLELYAGGNLITNTREVLTLKKLSSLLILDLHGNPLNKDTRSCRLYVAYHLPSLKAYNGAPLESHELTSAKEMYGGRLNAEFILERTGHSRFNELLQADYPSCALRTVQLQPEETFSGLMSLNLEQNQLTSMSSLMRLPQLKVLCLNHNRVERLAPPPELERGVVFPSLQVLHLAYNQLTSLLPLQLHHFTALRALFLQGNQLVSADGLQGLSRLTELVLDHNKIRNIGEQTFASQTQLLVLHIEENRLRDLSNIGWLLNVEKLFAGMNRLQEFSDLDELCALKHLNEVSLLSNPVARRLHYRTQVLCRLPNVTILDGVGVSEEERTRIKAMVQDQEPSESYGILHTSSGPFLVTNMTTSLMEGGRLGPHQTGNTSDKTLRK